MVIELNDNKLHDRGIICYQKNLQNNNIFSPYFSPENFIIFTFIYLAIIEFGFRTIWRILHIKKGVWPG